MNATTPIIPAETLSIAPGVIQFTTDNAPLSIAGLTDREKLMLIDAIAETMSDEINDELTEGLAAAFERAELGRSGTFVPLYPFGAIDRHQRAAWRIARNAILANKGLAL